MNTELVKYEKKGKIAVITLCAKTNILGPKTNPSFCEAIMQAERDPEVVVIVLAGNGGKCWIAGADLKTMQYLDPPGAVDFITDLHDTIALVREITKPVIASVNGHCYGGGLELAISCDFIIASENATFGMQEVVLGMPSVIEASIFPFMCGMAKTREWLMLGEVFDSAVAERYNLINYVVKPEDLEAETMKWAEKFAALPPHALKLQKQLMFRWLENAGVEASTKNGIDFFGNSYAYNVTQPKLQEMFSKKK